MLGNRKAALQRGEKHRVDEREQEAALDNYYHGRTVRQEDSSGRISNYIVITESVTLPPPVSEMLDAWIVPIDEPVVSLQILQIELTGRDCAADQDAAAESIAALYNNSPTARTLIDAAAAKGVQISLSKDLLSGIAGSAYFNGDTNILGWDPFLVVRANNADGSEYTLPPIMILAHELVHAGSAENSSNPAAEYYAVQVANQIASDMNAVTGSNYGTSRGTYKVSGLATVYFTDKPTSTESAVRPDCS